MEGKENPYRYAGYYWDKETEYYYLRARYYDPETARFITEDSFTGRYDDPLSLNLYTYCHNNPIRYIDITGNDIYEVFMTWTTSAWWLCAADGPALPFGDIIYVGGFVILGLLTVGTAIITGELIGEKINDMNRAQDKQKKISIHQPTPQPTTVPLESQEDFIGPKIFVADEFIPSPEIFSIYEQKPEPTTMPIEDNIIGPKIFPLEENKNIPIMWARKKGKSRNKPKQQGEPNSVEAQYDSDNNLEKYTVFDENGNFVKEVRVTGKDHGNIPRPNVKEPVYHTDPNTGQTFHNGYEVRPAEPWELELPK